MMKNSQDKNKKQPTNMGNDELQTVYDLRKENPEQPTPQPKDYEEIEY